MKTRTRFAFCLLMLFTLPQCGEEGKASKADFDIVPGKPIVITGDIEENGTTIKAPWFKFTASLTNNTGDSITLVAMKVEVIAISESGATSTVEKSFAPSMANYSTISGFECAYKTFGTWADGETKKLRFDNGSSSCLADDFEFTVDSLPKQPGSNFRYRVRLTPLGWFGTETEPTDRFTKQLTIYTQ